METIEIICLANSRKYQGRCVAGLRTDGSGWVRPVGPIDHGQLYPWHYTLADGTEARLLDVIRVSLDRPCPKPYQPEDWTVAEKTTWELRHRPVSPATGRAILRPRFTLGPSLLGTIGDRIPEDALADRAGQPSLCLVWPRDLHWEIRGRDQHGRSRQMRAGFTLRSAPYNLSITDQEWAKRLDHLPSGVHSLQAAGVAPDSRIVLTISLGEPYQGWCYKLVAAVIVIPDDWPRRA